MGSCDKLGEGGSFLNFIKTLLQYKFNSSFVLARISADDYTLGREPGEFSIFAQMLFRAKRRSSYWVHENRSFPPYQSEYNSQCKWYSWDSGGIRWRRRARLFLKIIFSSNMEIKREELSNVWGVIKPVDCFTAFSRWSQIVDNSINFTFEQPMLFIYTPMIWIILEIIRLDTCY